MRERIYRGFHLFENGKEEILLNGLKVKGDWIIGEGYKKEINYEGKERYSIGSYASSAFYPLQKTILWSEVVPETVSEYTNIDDVNGTKIFEHDKLSFGNEIGIINYDGGCFCVKDTTNKNNPAIDIIINRYDDIKVLGNIFSNP